MKSSNIPLEELKQNTDLNDKKSRIDDIINVSSHEELVLNLLDKLDIIRPDYDKNLLYSNFIIADLDCTKPPFFSPKFTLDKKVIIRSCSNMEMQTGIN